MSRDTYLFLRILSHLILLNEIINEIVDNLNTLIALIFTMRCKTYSIIQYDSPNVFMPIILISQILKIAKADSSVGSLGPTTQL